MASAILMNASQPNTITKPGCAAAGTTNAALPAMIRQMMPMAMLATGPAIAMLNSLPGVPASFSIWAMPPSANNVMPRTGRPLNRATLACASSCRTMHTKNSTAVNAAEPQMSAGDQDGLNAANCLVSDNVMSHAITNQL